MESFRRWQSGQRSRRQVEPLLALSADAASPTRRREDTLEVVRSCRDRSSSVRSYRSHIILQEVGNPRSNHWDVEFIRPDRFYVWQESWIDDEEVYDEWIALGEDLYINAGMWMKVDVPARRELNEAFAIETFLGLLDTVLGDQCSAYKLKGRTFLGLTADGMPPQLYVDPDVKDSAPDLLEGATILWIDDASRLPAKIHARARYEEEGASVLVKF